MSLKLSIIALTPPGFAGAWSARAIGRSHPGLVGGASLEYSDAAQVRQAIGQLSEQTDAFTVAVGRVDDELLAVVKSAIGGGLVRVILCDADASRLSGDIQSLREGGVEAFVEATCLKEAQLAEQCRADGVVVKGNEAGGRVGQETTFILLQQVVGQVDLPVYARGGVGLFTSAACQAAGAAGVVLDWQLALCAESEVPEAVKTRIGRMDGSETAILGQDCPVRFRAYARPGETAFTALQALEASEELVSPCPDGVLGSWRAEVHRRAMVEALDERLLLIGQDAAFAGLLAEGTRGLVGICRAIQKEAGRLCRVAAHQKALAPHGPLAEAQGTRYPIVQGPMTRVSDTAEFAGAVARGGGLPFLALALLRGPDVAKLLVETKDNVGDQPWGIGILGFVPKELREEQLAEVSKCPPPFAIIAGGRPDQALALEQKGIKTYLHVPSPGLLGMFLSSGARRVIFEGRECGGHVGPRTSFALWESMIHVILQHLADTGRPGEDYHVLFAGGIHDAVSAAMVAALAAPLSERGVRIGALMGTAYLFTHEAVASGAIVPGFQQQAIACRETVLLETGVGHATRCAHTSFGEQFLAEKRRLRAAGASKDDIRHKLEMLNLGRLRVASKAITRSTAETNPATDSKFAPVDEEGQLRDGMYMIGQVAALRDATCSIEELHQEVSRNGIKHLEALDVSGRAVQKLEPCDVAIIGMSCVLPKAPDVRRFWSNIVGGVNAITEVPADLWDAELYFDGDRRARDKVYSKWGGFIEAIDFDPMHYGMPPNSLPSVEPLQLLTLELVRRALRDAGCEDRPFDREHTCVVLGAGGGVGNVGLGYGFRSMLPHYLDRANRPDLDAEELIQRLGDELPEWTEDSFAGLLLNVAAGRVANRFDLGGANYVVDAACASSLAAVRLATNELRSGAANLAIVGGVDTMQSPFAYLCFSKTQALSPRGQSCPFDESGDGIVISEGLAMVVLKRLEDAERDGDRIYAVIKGVGSSSDGKDKGLTAPRPAGQVRALERAYEQAGVSPRTVGLIEAHGTGTVVGDKTEVESLQSMFEAAGADRQSCAIGSVKSMIGHTKCTAGVAGLIKAALALHHKVLPPTHGVTTPNPKANFSESPFYVNTEARPWVHPEAETPRRAGVSAFGFGGTNFHAVLEEHGTDDELMEPVPGRSDWPGELFVWHRSSPEKLTEAIDSIAAALDEGAAPELPELAEAIGRANAGQQGTCRLAIVADALDDLAAKLKSAASSIKSGKDDIRDPRGIYYGARVEPADGKMAAVFAGQGSQSVNMMRDLALTFPCVRRVFERADRALGDTLGKRLSEFVFVRPTFSDQERAEAQQALTQTRVAQPAIGAADLAAFELLRSLGVRPSFACGHSYGEYAALSAAGVLSFDELIRVSEARGRTIAAAAEDTPGTMAAVRADARKVTQAIEGIDGVWVANFNSPTQTVITGTEQGVTDALERLTTEGVAGRRIQVSCAFHSPLVAAAREPFARCLDDIAFEPMRFEVYSNTTAQPHACDPAAVKAQLVAHLAKPVRFDEQIKAMHDAGARVFVGVGPGRTLTALVEQILEGRDFVAVAMDQAGRDGLVSLLHALARMTCAGINLDPGVLFEGRATRGLDVDRLVEQTKPAPPSPTTWSVSGSKAVPRNGGTRPTQAVPSGNGRPAASSNERQPATHARESARSRDRAGAVKEAAPVSRPPAPAGPTETNGGRDSVLGAHHQLMARFLETHKTVMLGYLQGASNGDGSHEAAARSSQSIQAGDATEVDPSHAATGPALPTARASAPETMDAAPPVVSEPGTDEPVTSPALAVGESAAFSREALIDRMLAVVSERTGYPADMLDLDQDLEADLGIDSIKRIEILGGLQNDGILGVEREADDADMEALAKLSTLRAIVEWVEARVGESGESESGAGDNGAPKPTAKEGAGPIREVTVARDPQPRMLLQAVEAPLAQDGSDLPVEGTVLITDDRSGVAQHLASRLESAGVSCVITPVDASGNGAPGGSATNLADPAAAARFVERLRKQHGRIAAIVHLHPMHNQTLGEPLDPIRWRAALDAELNSLFNLVQGLESDLRQGGTGAVLAAVRMGGRFGSVETEQWAEFRPGQGGVCGLVKSLAREWEDVNCKVIDFDLEASPQDVAESVMAELVARDRRSEVGYCRGARTALAPTQITLQGRDVALDLDCDSVVVVTGGARGITADVAMELAERFSLKLVLLGRSPLPPAQEASETASVSDARQLKAVIRSRIEREGQRATPALVETQYKQLCRQREMRANLAAMREAGATVDYRPVDVSDSAAFAAALDDIYAQYGRIDGAIHGAGLIEDKRVCDKTPESFARVMNPKVNGALVLAHKLRSESLRFLVFFSSVSGRYGNKGQCDYAAANEVLNKLAVWLNARWPGRVTSLNWGPWESSGGMVSAELAKQFAQAGIRLIGRREGRHLFLDELLYGTKNEAEVVLGGPLRVDPVPPAGSKRESVAEASADLNAPLLIDRVATVHQSNGSIEVARRLDPAHDVYLLDHQLDGAPVMPMAMMLELFAEVASSVRPGLHLVSLRDVRMLGGITLADDARPLVRVFGSVTAEVDGGVDVDLRAECDDNGRTRYAATAQLRPSVPPSIESSPLQLASPRALGLSVSEAYRQWLFHGPIFAGITEVEAVGDDGIIARISASSPQRCLAESSARGWQVDPVVVDCSLQLLIIWSRTYLDATPLPSRLGCYHRYGGQLRGDLRCEVRIVSVEGPTLRSDVRFYNAAGSLVGRMDDMELTCSQVLNRLAGAAGGRA